MKAGKQAGSRYWLLIIMLLLLQLSAGCDAVFPDPVDASEDSYQHSETVQADTESSEPAGMTPKKPERLRLAVVGDLMVHGPQIRAQQQSDGSYDFHNNFDFVRPWLQEADIVLGNLETTFGGAERGYSSFPRFNTPDAFGEALKEAGFTAVSTVNNHTIDTGSEGFFRTLEVLKQQGLTAIGTRDSQEEPYWHLFTENGITLGVTAVSYETPRAYGRRTLNALVIPRDLEGLINSFDYHTLEADLVPVKEQIAAMKEAGADVTVVLIHWGEEYQQRQNPWQARIANALAAAGADLILGSHPHVLQPVRSIQRDPESTPSWVVYSLGNFLSNQRFEILRHHESEDGVILFVNLIRDPDHQVTIIENVSYQPTWVHRYGRDGGMVYEIVPLIEALESPEAYHLITEESRRRAENSLERSLAVWDNLPLARRQSAFED
ncbi:MAG: CapA family protein [Bacillota bacterium]|nr:CapA family protein [Bacillota bacterium]MDW7676738.1 CapA family protein [Bacillota bacterium]